MMKYNIEYHDIDDYNRLQNAMRIEANLKWDGCLTGDCPHERQAECDKHLSDEVRRIFSLTVTQPQPRRTWRVRDSQVRAFLIAGSGYGAGMYDAHWGSVLSCFGAAIAFTAICLSLASIGNRLGLSS